MRVFRSILWGCLIVVVWASIPRAEGETQPLPAIEIEIPTYDFHQVLQGEVVKHDFRVFNRGGAPLEIKNVKPD
jgi:hypothetical protein